MKPWVLLTVWAVLGFAQILSPEWRIAAPAVVDLVFLDENRTLLVVSGDGLELWDVGEGKRAGFRARPNVTCVATNPARTVVALGVPGGVEVWDPATFALVQTLTHPRVQNVGAVAVSPSGRYVAGESVGNLVVWQTSTGDPIDFRSVTELFGLGGNVNALFFLSETELVMVGHLDVFLWEIGTIRVRKLGQMAYRTSRIAVDPRRRWVAFPMAKTPGERVLAVLAVDTGEVVAELPIFAGSDAWMEFLSDGRLLSPAYTRLGNGLHLFRVDRVPEAFCVLPRPADEELKLGSVSRDGSHVAVVEAETPLVYRISVYRLTDCRLQAKLGRWSKHTSYILASTDERWLVRVTSVGLEIWDTQTLTLHRTLLAPGIMPVALSPVAPVAAVGALYGSEIVVWNWETGAKTVLSLELATPEESFWNRAGHLVFTPDGTKLVIVHWSGDISLVSWTEKKLEWKVKAGETSARPAISPDGRLLFTAHPGGLRVWDVASGQLVDSRLWGVYPEGLYFLDSTTLVISGSGHAPGIPGVEAREPWTPSRFWHLLSFTPAGRIVDVKSLGAPAGIGAPLGDGRTLVILESPAPTEDPSFATLWLWDARRDVAVHRWNVGLVPSPTRFPRGGVVPLSRARRAVLWAPMTSVNLYSLNIPPRVLSVRVSPVVVLHEVVEFCAQAEDPEGGPLRFFWDVGEGALREGECVRLSYTQEGTYPVRLLVMDDVGATASWEGVVSAVKSRPDFAWTPSDPGVLEEILFQDASVPADLVVRVRWDFGDGALAEGREVRHRYAQPGTYTVQAMVSFADGRELRVERQVRVEDVSCVHTVPAPGAPRFYWIRLSARDQGRLRFGDTLWLVRRAEGGGWTLVARVVVFTPQAEGAWVVLAEAFRGLEPRVGDRVMRERP